MLAKIINEVNICASDIHPGDTIPIGGSIPGKFNIHVVANTDSFATMFESMRKNAQNLIQNPQMNQWLNHMCGDALSPELFAHMYVFDNSLRQVYPNLSANIGARNKFYGPDAAPTVSDAVQAGVCQCAEISILAVAYLQYAGISAQYFGGGILRSKTEEFADQHSFVLISNGAEKWYTILQIH